MGATSNFNMSPSHEFERPTVVDLCAGVGGFSLGFQQAGFDPVLAIDIEPAHILRHGVNMRGCSSLRGDIRDTASVVAAVPFRGSQIGVVIGSPPCQGFSKAGKQDSADSRRGVTMAYAEAVIAIRPKYFVMENVPELATAGVYELLAIIDRLTTAGYEVPIPQILNAAQYGVPQRRHRLFLWGWQKGLTPPVWPSSLTSPAITCAEALDDLGDCASATARFHVADDDQMRYPDFNRLSRYALRMRSGANSVSGCRPVRHTSKITEEFSKVAPGRRHRATHATKLIAHAVAPTLTAGNLAQRGTAKRPIHYKYPRMLSVRECARLMGFPDSYCFDPRKIYALQQIGNAVCPPVANAIARQILLALVLKGSSSATRSAAIQPPPQTQQ